MVFYGGITNLKPIAIAIGACDKIARVEIQRLIKCQPIAYVQRVNRVSVDKCFGCSSSRCRVTGLCVIDCTMASVTSPVCYIEASDSVADLKSQLIVSRLGTDL